MKLEDHLYLVKKGDGRYIVAKPVYDTWKKDNHEHIGWRDQDDNYYPHFADFDIIGSVERIEERRWARQQIEKKVRSGGDGFTIEHTPIKGEF